MDTIVAYAPMFFQSWPAPDSPGRISSNNRRTLSVWCSTRPADERSNIEVNKQRRVIRRRMYGLGHLREMLEEIAILAAPHSLAKHAGTLNLIKELR